MDSYRFIYYKNEKYGEPITREVWIKTKGGRRAAVNLFMQACGNLKKNTIVRAEEYTVKGMEYFTPEVIKQGRQWVAA